MRRFFALVVPLFVLALAGCGGGGSVDGPSDGTGPIGVFVTDAFSDDFDQVWTTIYRVELLGASGTTEVVFDDPAGRVLNIKTLRDATGARFAFLGGARASASVLHTDARVTVGPEMTLFARSATTGQSTPVDASLPRDAQNHPQIRFALANARRLGQNNDDLVIDFDLSRFLIVGGQVIPALSEGTRTALADAARQDDRTHRGVVSNLAQTGLDRTFTLTTAGGTAFLVATDANTVVFNASGASRPALANGAAVEARGTFDINAERLLAAQVRIEDASGTGNDAQVRGAVLFFPTTYAAYPLDRFVVEAAQVRGLVPTQTGITVVTGPNTLFRAASGLIITSTEFYDRIISIPAVAGPQAVVEAEGVYNAAANALLARTARIEFDGGSAVREVYVSGPPTNVSAAAGTFTINPAQTYDGFTPAAASVPVVTTAATTFLNASGEAVAATTFFATLFANPAADVAVAVNGAPASGGAITARRVRAIVSLPSP